MKIFMAKEENLEIGIIGSGEEWPSLPVVRQLGKKSNTCYLLLQNLKTPATYSRYLMEKYQIPKEMDIELVKDIVDICNKEEITHIICLNEEIKYQLIKNKKYLVDLNYAFPDIKSYEIALKKSKSSEFVENLGIPVPETIRITSLNELRTLEFNFEMPKVIKGVRGVSSLHIRYASNREELLEFYKEIYEIEKSDEFVDSLPIIQEYIGGPTYLTQGLAQNGEVKVVVPHVKIREWPISGGVTTRARTINEPRLIEYMKRIMEELEWHGEAGMEWKYDKERDDFYFIEMNPRFEGSLDIAIKAGVNMPVLLMKIIDGEEIPSNIKFKPDIHYRWFFRNDFKYFLHRPYGLGRLLWESFNPKVHGEITLDDIGVLRGFWKQPIREFVHYLKG